MSECIEKAAKFADAGSAAAQFCRGLCLLQGYGVAKNLEEATQWLRKASEQNFAPAQERLGMCLLRGIGIAENKTEGFELIRKAAEQDFAPAQFSLGYCYSVGDGVKEDEKESLKWYLKAADNGDAVAQKNVGTIYLLGLAGTEKNLEEALSWFKKSTAQGDTEATEIVRRMENFEKDKTEPETAKTDTKNEKPNENIETNIETDNQPANTFPETKKVFVKGRFNGISQDGKWLFYTGDNTILGVRLSDGQNFRCEIKGHNFLGFAGAKISTDGKYAQIEYSVAAGKWNEPLADIRHITVHTVGNNAGKRVDVRAKYLDTISTGQPKKDYIGYVYYQDVNCVISVKVDEDGKIFTVYVYGENPT
jgi:tetratricopeptide (TPR) repeat protein